MVYKWFTIKNLRLHGSQWDPVSLLLQQNHAKKSRRKPASNSDSNPKQKSQLNTELPPREINHSFCIGNFLSRTFVCFKNHLPSSGLSMDIGGGTLQYTTRHSRNQNLQRSTMGGGQRSRIPRDPHSRTLGVIPRGDLRHFVVDGINFWGDFPYQVFFYIYCVVLIVAYIYIHVYIYIHMYILYCKFSFFSRRSTTSWRQWNTTSCSFGWYVVMLIHFMHFSILHNKIKFLRNSNQRNHIILCPQSWRHAITIFLFDTWGTSTPNLP